MIRYGHDADVPDHHGSATARRGRRGSRRVNGHASRILIAEDNEQIRALLRHLLDGYGYSCEAVANAHDARELLGTTGFDLLLSDVNMPGGSGLELAQHVLEHHPDTAVVMVTAVDDPNVAEQALERGAYGYVIKPFSSNEILINVANGIRRRKLEVESRRHRELLEQAVLERTAALNTSLVELRRSREETIERLARAAETRDDATGLHITRVSRYCHTLARLLGLDPDRCELIRIVSPLHDIGKIAIPDRILLKPGPLSPGERAIMQGHAEAGHRMLLGSGEDLLELAALLAWTHHERYDGAGYPRRLAGTEIPIEGRIAAVADVFDALTSDRVYRPALALEEALEIIRAGRGTQFDPDVLDAFLGSLDEVVRIRDLAAPAG
jgi:putative two-component system response regulator